jgi:transposase
MVNFTQNENSNKPQKISKRKEQSKNTLGYIDPTVAGIDIGDKLIHVSIPNSKKGVYVKEFSTTTPQLYNIAKELKAAGVTTAVMEATGVYWVPLYEILESLGFKAVLVDARKVKNVPGRKTDVVDCQWIQTLYSNGLLNAAFRPPKDSLVLRSHVRHRLSVVKRKQKALLHMEKMLQLMNIKLSTAVAEIGGVTGMNIIRAIVAGERDPVQLARLRNQNCQKAEELFIEALTGNFRKEHVFALKQSLDYFDFCDGQLKECDQKILEELEKLPDVELAPLPKRDKDKNKTKKFSLRKKPNRNDVSFDVREVLWRKSGRDFTALPGVEANTALLIFAELGGVDMSSFQSAKHFASWLKLCPGNNISGGKRRKSKNQPCASYLNQALRMSALAAKRSKSAIGAHIRRVTGKTDKPKGIKAGAHKIAILLYGMCKEGWKYFEKGEDYYEKAYEAQCVKALHKKAKEFGYILVAA